MPGCFRFADEGLEPFYGLANIVAHLCCRTNLNVKRRIPLVDISSGKRVPECIQIVSVPLRCAYRCKIIVIEIAGHLPRLGVKNNLFHS